MQTAEEDRLSRLCTQALAHEMDAVLVTEPANVRYFTGFSGSSGLLVIAAGGAAAAPGEHRFVTDFRYREQAAEEVDLQSTVIEGGTLLEAACERIAELGARRVAYEDRHVPVATHAKMCELVGEGVELVGLGETIESLREVKDAGEQRRIAESQRLADRALVRTMQTGGLQGRTEREVAMSLEWNMRELGASAAAFPTIVASGAHAALPHAQPRDVTIGPNTPVLIDWGAVLDGYCSDSTRTYMSSGEGSGRITDVWTVVRAAMQAAMAVLRPGLTGREVDAAARTVIEEAGYGEQFGHGLGHGVGLEVHEGPRLSKTAGDDPLREGTVVTIEPGIYLSGELGVRVEDLVVVTAEGYRNLSTIEHGLKPSFLPVRTD